MAFGGAEVEVVDAALVEGGAGGGEDDDFGSDAGAGAFGEELFLVEEGEGADLEEFFVLHDLGHEEVGFGVNEVEGEAVFEGFGDGVDFRKEGVGGVAERRAEEEDGGFFVGCDVEGGVVHAVRAGEGDGGFSGVEGEAG